MLFLVIVARQTPNKGCVRFALVCIKTESKESTFHVFFLFRRNIIGRVKTKVLVHVGFAYEKALAAEEKKKVITDVPDYFLSMDFT